MQGEHLGLDALFVAGLLDETTGQRRILPVGAKKMDFNEDSKKMPSKTKAFSLRPLTSIFGTALAVTLYDLTNTYFEGEAGGQPKARRGHSKEKRTDCPLLTLGLVLDASGFVRRSQVFAGNVREHHTLAEMLDALNAPRAALVVMDRGIATEDRVQWLREHGYRYLVVSRERTRHFDAEATVRVETASSHGVHLHKVLSDDAQEVRLYCFSEERAAKERGIVERFAKRFKDADRPISLERKVHEGRTEARPRQPHDDCRSTARRSIRDSRLPSRVRMEALGHRRGWV